MGRPSIQVNEELLKQIINECESSRTYINRNELFKDVAAKYGAKSTVEISPSVVYLRVREYNIELKTPKGKKGKSFGETPNKGVRVKREAKLAKDQSAQHTFVLLRKEIMHHDNGQGRFLPVLKRAEKGSIKAIIKLMCLTCANWQPAEIKHCECLSCPLHPIRAYK